MGHRIRMLLTVLPLVGMVGCVQEDQIKRLEQETGDLKVEVFRMRQQVEELNRRSEGERASFSEGRSQDRRFQADMQDTLRQLQDATRVLANRLKDAPATAVVPPVRSVSQPVAEPPAVSEDAAFKTALLDYSKGNYDLAVEGLDQFLAAHPKSAKHADALYYLGYSHFNLKAYDKAFRAFDRLTREHPSSELFLSAKYKRAICQLRQGLKAAGAASLQELVREFPDTPEGRNAQQDLADLQ